MFYKVIMPVIYLKMFNMLLLCPILLAAGAQTLTIDSQLGTSIEDCFERITIGEQIPHNAIYRNITELTTRECEKLCRQDKQCQSFDYGVGAKGNATCELSTVSEKELRENKILQRHPDFDVYVRRFQCEQSPPSPLQPQFDDPGPGPTHRPIYRPENDDQKRPEFNRPQSDEVYQRPSSHRPHPTFDDQKPSSQYYNYYDVPFKRPIYRPEYNLYNNHIDYERPDDQTNQRPEFDSPLGYGPHKPQGAPFRPENTYRPHYNQSYGKPKPDPYDVLHFQDQYNVRPQKPQDHGYYRPDPNDPGSPADDIQDLYGQKPRPERPNVPIEEKPQYQYFVRPNRKPSHTQIQRPENDDGGYGHNPLPPKPSHDFPSSGYGENDHSHIGTPYRPNTHYYDQYAGGYGQSSHYNQDNYIYLEINDPPNYLNKPTNKPLQDNQNLVGYGQYGSNYGQNYNRPIYSDYRPSKPSYYGTIHDVTSTYGSQSYNSHRPSDYPVNHDRPQSSYGNQKPQDDYQKPGSYGNNRPYHDSLNEGIYGSNGQYYTGAQGSYGSSNQGYYGSNKPSHDSNPGSYGSSNQGSYGSNKPLHDSNQGSYGSSNQGSYGNNKPLHDSNQGSYGSSNQGSYSGNKPSHDINQGSYGSSNQGYYGSNKPLHDSNQGSYGSSNQGTYGSSNQESYGSNKPLHDSTQGSYGSSNQGYYGSNNPSHDSNQGSYGSNNQGYGTSYQKPSYTSGDDYKNTQSYGSQKPSSNYGNSNTDPIGNTSYSSDAAKPAIKPVYEYEFDKPHGVPSYIVRPDGEVISSKPVAISDGGRRPATGREPGLAVSYKSCFRRVLAGRRALRSHVRRVLACERLEDCRRECAIERRFHCESFNYRLDPSFRGKGLCEMMTKPIEAFDVRRDFVDDKDYDFYELDRNSLEPNCPSTLRGPGYLHSGYLSSKPDWRPGYQDQWTDRQDTNWDYNERFNYRDPYERFDDRRGGSSRHYGRRRHEDQFFIPYQIGVGRSNDQESWGQYGGAYGGFDTYYKDRNDFRNSLNHWRLHDEKYERPDSFYGVRPYGSVNDFNYHSLGNRKFEGSWGNYGYGYGTSRRGWNDSGHRDWGGLSYGESNYYGPRKEPATHYYEEQTEPPAKDCSSRRRPGMSLGSGAIRRSLLAQNVLDCEAACFNEREFKCVSYSYRYSNSHGTDNCFLSERPYRGLDLASDSGSDVYAMPQDHHCSLTHKPWIESECFWHVRSGAAVSGVSVKAALTVAGLGACEAECIRAHGFFCRGFSFRFDSPTIGDDLENCLLTSSPPTTLEPGHGVRVTPGHELYARGNYGRGCEPAIYDEHAHREKQCYLKYDSAARLIGAAVRGQARVKDEQACGAACTDAPFRCLSFSYNNNSPPNTDNCLLSEVRLFDLQRGVDYRDSPNDWLFAFDLFNGQCWRKASEAAGKDENPTQELPRPIAPPPRPNYGPPVGHPSGPYAPSGPHPSGPYAPSGPHPSGPYAPSGPHPSGPYAPSGPRPSGPGYIPDPGLSGPGFVPSELPGPTGPVYRPRPSGPSYLPERPEKGYNEIDGPMSVSWLQYTVSGFPCRRGTVCAVNRVGEHWSCEPEGGEVGAWDYCCAPEHRCGYSEGFPKPWCYVGSSVEQWRPCSDKYYPYHQHNTPHPSQGHRENHRPGYEPSIPWSHPRRPPGVDSYLPIEEDTRKPAFVGSPYLPEGDRKYWDDLYKNGPSAYYDRNGNPLPGYVRVPMADRPHIKYHHNYGPRPGDGSHWLPVAGLDSEETLDPPVPGGLGVPRYWPVAYLHKGPPPNMTYFRFNETEINRTDRRPTTTTQRYEENLRPEPPRERPPTDFHRPNQERLKPNNFIDNNNKENHRDEKTRNITAVEKDIFNIEDDKKPNRTTVSNTPLPIEVKENISATDIKTVEAKDKPKEDLPEGLDGKLDDLTGSIEVLDIEDAKTKGEKQSDLKTLEAEEKQIEAIGRLLASRRGGKLVLEKRSQKDLEAKNVAIDKELMEDDFNFGTKFPTAVVERRGIIQKVTKDEVEAEMFKNNDKSLEVSETTFVRPPRVLSTAAPINDNIRKAYVNGKVFYDATVRERDLFVAANATRKQKTLNFLKTSEDSRLSPLTQSFGKKKIKPRNVNPVRRARRIYRKRYNPEEVRRRLLEREKSLKENTTLSMVKKQLTS